MRVVVKSVDPMPAGIFAALLAGAITLASAMPIALVGLVDGLRFGLLFFQIGVVLFAVVIGFLGGYGFASLYNALARRYGGLSIEVDS